jgi:hypothetical protein
MFIRALFAAALLMSPARAASPQSEGFKRLTGPQIQKVFRGKQFSDGIHFSYRFAAGGTMQSTRMGKTTTDKWAVAKDKLCMTDSFGENCYTVWAKGSEVKFAIDGSDFSLEGILK